MNAGQWMEEWKEGVAQLDNATVSIERMKHQTAYLEQELNRLDEQESKSTYGRIKRWFTRS